MKATSLLPIPKVKLIDSDGEPLESAWHVYQIYLLIDLVHGHFAGRDDYFVGGNMFIYYSLEQAKKLNYRGPDFFFVKAVKGKKKRKFWVVWEEDGRYPDVIIELLSPSTARTDLTTKKQLYERTFHTHEYFCYDPDKQQLRGWRINSSQEYDEIVPTKDGRLYCEEFDLWLGTSQGVFQGQEDLWLRFFTRDGKLTPTQQEAASQQSARMKRRVEKEKQRADAAEVELARLRAELKHTKPGNGTKR